MDITGGDGVPPGPDLVTLRDAYNRDPEFFGVLYESVRKARRRDKKAGRWLVRTVEQGNSDDGEADRYHYPAVQRWWLNRPRAHLSSTAREWVVYFIVRGGVIREHDIVKFGFTGNLYGDGGRLEDFHDIPEDVVYLIRCESKAEAMEVERRGKRKWVRYHRAREQYYMRGDLLAFLRKVAPDHVEALEVPV